MDAVYRAVVAALICLGSGKAQNNVLDSIESAQGFQLLFDGNIASFRSNFVNYIQNGTAPLGPGWIVNIAEQAIVSSGATPNIRSIRTYRDFDLRMDYRNPGNAGVFYRHLLNQPSAFYTGVEFEVDENLNQSLKSTAGAAYDLFPPVQPNPYKLFATNEWNSMRIVAKGDSVEHWLNGIKVVGYKYDTPEFWAAVANSKWSVYPSFCLNIPGDSSSGYIQQGYIGLQGDWGGAWHIRNFRILDDTRGTVLLGPPSTTPISAFKIAEKGMPLEIREERGRLRCFFGSKRVNSSGLYDLQGRLLAQMGMPTDASHGEFELEGIPRGAYFLRISTQTGVFHRKIFIRQL